MSISIDVDRFFGRLAKLHSSFKSNKAFWSGAKSLLIHRGALNDDEPYLRSVVFQQWVFGYELPDTVMLLKEDGHVWFLATKKKIEFLRPAEGSHGDFEVHLLLRNKEDGNAENYQTLLTQAGVGEGDEPAKVGVIAKERAANKTIGGILGPWEAKLDEGAESKSLEVVDIAPGLAVVMAPKESSEWDLMKKSSVLSNKVMKHGCVKRLEEIIEEEATITHEKLATEIEAILEDPSKIKLNVPTDDVQSCYFPIVQSGGVYDLRVSAQSSQENLKHDVITVSLGARYKNYCTNIGRTFLVDPPQKVSAMYEALVEMQEACLAVMQPGRPLKVVYKAAVKYLRNSGNEDLVPKLPKTLGFAQGLDFRDSTLTLSAKNGVTFKKGMVFCLSVGFANLELSSGDRSKTPEKSAVKKISKYGMLICDMVSISDKSPELLTKMGKGLTDIAYNINDDDEDDDEDADGDDDDDEDAQLARKLSREPASTGVRQSARLARDSTANEAAAEGVAERERQQIKLLRRRNEERLREIARENLKKRGKGQSEEQAEELTTYKSTREYPPNVQPNQVKVDMASQCVILPICGNPVPFHISTIKNVVLPDPDNATLLRINFYTAGMAVGKDAPANMAKLVQKYAPYASFIREMTFRSLDGHNLVQAFRQISELRKRARTKELREMEEANLVVQEKLVRTKNERVPRLSDLTMRPVFAGRKTQGNLESHTNGMRFISTSREVVDIMYGNIKYAIFQPCINEIMVLLHFHLKNPIMVGKKKQRDIQFFTEVVDASQAVDNGRRSMYDPDEMDDEQRERQLRKRLNQAFSDFRKKVEAVARKNNYNLEFDIPYRELGFTGNPHKEMVTILPSLNCLVNLTETPFFVVDLEGVDHVHFERVTYMSKAFDMIIINKDFAKQPWRIDMIPNADKDGIQDWLTGMDITYTEGPMNLNWKSIMGTVKDDDRFYMTTEEDEVTEKDAGWEFLRMYGRDEDGDDDDDEDDSEFGEQSEDEDDGEDESDEEEAFDSEEDESDFDADEELEEQGMDWDEMEKEAAMEDKRKRRRDDIDEDPAPRRRGSSNRRDSSNRGGSSNRRGSANRGGNSNKRSRR